MLSIFFEVHCLIRDEITGKKWPKITDIRFVCYRGIKKRFVRGQSLQIETIPYFFFKLIFFALSQSLWPLHFFSKPLLIHRIVEKSACKPLGDDVYHIIIKIKCFRVTKSGVFTNFFAVFNFL